MKTCRGTKKHSKYAFSRKAHTKTNINNNDEHIYNLKGNLLNIQVDINTQLLYMRLKLNFNTCSCGI